MSDVKLSDLNSLYNDLYAEVYQKEMLRYWSFNNYSQPVILGYEHGVTFGSVQEHPDAHEPEILEEEW